MTAWLGTDDHASDLNMLRRYSTVSRENTEGGREGREGMGWDEMEGREDGGLGGWGDGGMGAWGHGGMGHGAGLAAMG